MAGALEFRIVEVRTSDAIPPVPADRELVLIVLRQLLDNAVKYSPPGSSIVIGAAEEEGSVVVTVTDCGPGIPQADLNRVFEKFYRGPHARERVPGTGMGLAIAREIVRGHGGDLSVVSRPGQGSEFSFALPLAEQETRP
jgi:signal transduction histidine kinase